MNIIKLAICTLLFLLNTHFALFASSSSDIVEQFSRLEEKREPYSEFLKFGNVNEQFKINKEFKAALAPVELEITALRDYIKYLKDVDKNQIYTLQLLKVNKQLHFIRTNLADLEDQHAQLEQLYSNLSKDQWNITEIAELQSLVLNNTQKLKNKYKGKKGPSQKIYKKIKKFCKEPFNDPELFKELMQLGFLWTKPYKERRNVLLQINRVTQNIQDLMEQQKGLMEIKLKTQKKFTDTNNDIKRLSELENKLQGLEGINTHLKAKRQKELNRLYHKQKKAEQFFKHETQIKENIVYRFLQQSRQDIITKRDHDLSKINSIPRIELIFVDSANFSQKKLLFNLVYSENSNESQITFSINHDFWQQLFIGQSPLSGQLIGNTRNMSFEASTASEYKRNIKISDMDFELDLEFNPNVEPFQLTLVSSPKTKIPVYFKYTQEFGDKKFYRQLSYFDEINDIFSLLYFKREEADSYLERLDDHLSLIEDELRKLEVTYKNIEYRDSLYKKIKKLKEVKTIALKILLLN